MEDKNEISTYTIHNTNEDVSFCEQVECSIFSPTNNGNVRKDMCKTSDVNFLEQVRTTSSITYNTKGRISSEGLNNLFDGVRNLQSKGSDLDSSSDETKSEKDSGSRVVSDALVS